MESLVESPEVRMYVVSKMGGGLGVVGSVWFMPGVLVEKLRHRIIGSLLYSTRGLVLESGMLNPKVQPCCQPTE